MNLTLAFKENLKNTYIWRKKNGKWAKKQELFNCHQLPFVPIFAHFIHMFFTFSKRIFSYVLEIAFSKRTFSHFFTKM